mgnify:CR=1 FL=1
MTATDTMGQNDLIELERARAALAASEERLALVLKGSNDGWWDWDLVTDTVFYAPRWWTMLGYLPDELPADSRLWHRLLHPEDVARVELVLHAALSPEGPEHVELECRLRHKQGHHVPVLARGHLVRDADGRPLRMSGTNTDLTARVQAEEARRQSDAAHDALLDAMADGVFVAQDYRFVFANAALPAMLGHAHDAFVGLRFDQVVDPEFLAMWTQRFEQRVSQAPEPTRNYELRFLLAGRRGTLWVELRASRIDYRGRRSVLGIVRDVGERKQAEAALAASRRIAQSTLDGLTAHICVLDEHGTVLSTNRAWRSFGAANGAALERAGAGVNYLAVCIQAAASGVSEAGQFADGLRAVLAGRRERFELAYPCQTADGQHWFLARVTRASGSGAVRVIVAHEDITEQVEAEHRIANLNERLALALQGAGYGVWEYELGTGALIWDEAMHAIYGLAPQSFGGDAERWRACLHPDDRAAVDARFAELMAGGRVDQFRFRIVRAGDGAERHIEANGYLQRDSEGRAQRLVGMNRDVTAQFEAEAALRESEQRWKFALEGAGDGVWDWDVPNERVLYSRRWKAMLGHDEDEVGGSFEEWRGRVHPDDLPGALTAIRAYFEGRTPTYQIEHRLRCKDGSWKWVLSRGLIVGRDADGRPLRMVGTHSDLSERKAGEAERALLEMRLREAQKMEAIGTLAGGVAHDFNNVLAGILGNVALARQDLGDGHAALTSLEQIQKAGLRARSLVKQVLAFSRRQLQQLASLALQPLFEETLALLRSTLPAGVALDVRMPAEPLHLRGDATQLQQVLMNLCTNAWHALGGRGGCVAVGLESLQLDAESAAARGLAAGEHLHLWVGDDGCGMDAESLQRIFEPFYTTKPVGQGTGLGLAVVHGIVTAHGGTIAVDSEPGRGSVFHLYFPPAAAPPQAAAETAFAVPAGGCGQHVLYVDDDEIMVLTVERLLARAGYRVSVHTDAAQAIDAVRAAPQDIDLVVTDFNMPGLSGLDVVRELAAVRSSLPVILSSGYLSPELREEALRAGVRGLLHKEHTVEELGGLVERVLAAR